MGSIRKRNRRYEARVYVNKKRLSKLFGTESEAKIWIADMEAHGREILAYGSLSKSELNYDNVLKTMKSNNKSKAERVADELLEIDLMKGHSFEKYCCELLAITNLLPTAKFQHTRGSGDFGADIVISLADNTTITVQCKRFKQQVSLGAVQEVVASKTFYKAKECMIITNSTLTNSADALATTNNVFVIDRDRLIKLIEMKIDRYYQVEHKNLWKNFTDKIKNL